MIKKIFPTILTTLTLLSGCALNKDATYKTPKNHTTPHTHKNCDTAIFSEFKIADDAYKEASKKYKSTLEKIPFSKNIHIDDINKDGKIDFMIKYERKF